MTFSNILIFLILAFLVVSWWWLFRRKPKSKYAEFPAHWRAILQEKVLFYQGLSDAEKPQFEQAILQFLNVVTITGVEVTVNDIDRLLVASSAVIPLFGFPGWHYRNLNEVLLYDDTFNENYQSEGEERNILGMVGNGAMQRMMILSKPALYQSFENQQSKNHVGIHEFVHLLDKADGTTDGIPEMLMQSQYTIPWLKMMHQSIQDIQENESDINPYGATNQAEFLSVVSEYFFTQPQRLEKKHPALYQMLEKVFRQDPADRH
jgi:Mlc titration factor MtfA (ptsG expression regulator)